MLYDYILGPKQDIKGGGQIKKLILSNKNAINSVLVRMKIKAKVKDTKDLLPEHLRNPVYIPRYVRVNTNKAKTEEIFEHFKKILNKEDENNVQMDEHISNLIVLPPNIDLHEDPYQLKGAIVLQDKASCFPSFILNPPLNSTVIDACSAPGNKTTHLSMIMKNTGNIFAFEKDKKRFQTLSKTVEKTGSSNIHCLNENFLETDPFSPKFSKVEYVLVDPSCSGSGIVSRLDFVQDEEEENEDQKGQDRLNLLAKFQLEIVLHAFKFPNVKRVTYSTCSVHQEENEMVVKSALEADKNFQIVHCLPDWKRRGFPLFDGAEHCIRTLASEDKTQGFFVACFERKNQTVEPNQPKKEQKKSNEKQKETHKIEMKSEVNEENNMLGKRKAEETNEPTKKKRKKKKKKSKQNNKGEE
eukprot:TRINITY_DN4169_c0_g3_i2.p1 TRINITY_DN4169_c0_g3~~TRINITY_DN4169_c0_g3_i2.p1  ORF type:complete len:413 (-),score=108.26 TRINITY_DN4169_c0_g3_i2:13-1251(-)